MPELKFLVPGPLTVSRDASCTSAAKAGEECGRRSRFVVERDDGDESFGSGAGFEETCEEHLGGTVLAMVSGDEGVRAVVTIRWDKAT